jgi:hypothetical protein
MAGRCALNAEIVVRVHGREPELWSIGRMADCLSARTGSIPVSSARSLREIRPAARTLVSKSRYEGSSPSSPAKSEHGIAAGASGSNPMTRVQLSLLAPCGSRLVAKTRRCQRRDRGFESRLPLQVTKSVRGGVAKTARHLPAKQIIGSAILPATSRVLRWCSSVGRARAS